MNESSNINRRNWMKVALASAAMSSLEVEGFSKQLQQLELGQTDDFWESVRQKFEVSPDAVNLVTSVRGVTTKVVREGLASETERLNVFQDLLDLLYSKEPRPPERSKATARQTTAKFIGALPEEVALLRNTTEGVTTVLMNWPLERGDEILVSSAEHFPYYDTLAQRAARDGIIIRKFHYPAPVNSHEDILKAIDQAMTDKTRLVMIGHVVLTGQINAARKIADLAHSRGAKLLVDGVLSVGHIETDVKTMDCDFFAAGFHKWGGGPRGTAVFYIRPDLVENLPPLFGAYQEKDGFYQPLWNDDRMIKYETFGAHPDAHYMLLAEALGFLDEIGISRIRKRLFQLTSRWVNRVSSLDRFRSAVRLHQDQCCGLVGWELDGIDSKKIWPILREHYVLVGSTDTYSGFFGIPKNEPRRLFIANAGIFTSESDVDRLADAIEDAHRRLG
ncbi:MAG: aminotransferase class V-fold PLP-dependent enzyme [Bacteroidota bacterium]